ncbi:hypothetical protein [Microbispora rosea]|uniref:hypothetical protein n=1 Tax=Microbispora rosea TaxID=58117 RepID=UPI003D937C48
MNDPSPANVTDGSVAATEVAQRAGHSVEVLQRVYAKCVEGQVFHVNNKITVLLHSQ